MADDHGSHAEHHAPVHVPEKEFYARSLQRLDEALRNIKELEERMAKRIRRSAESKPKAAD